MTGHPTEEVLEPEADAIRRRSLEALDGPIRYPDALDDLAVMEISEARYFGRRLPAHQETDEDYEHDARADKALEQERKWYE